MPRPAGRNGKPHLFDPRRLNPSRNLTNPSSVTKAGRRGAVQLKTTTSSAVALAAGLAADAVARGARPPITLIGVDARAWQVLASGGPSRAGDSLLLDEFGALWWGRVSGRGAARVTRACWPEEAAMCLDAIRCAMGQK